LFLAIPGQAADCNSCGSALDSCNVTASQQCSGSGDGAYDSCTSEDSAEWEDVCARTTCFSSPDPAGCLL